MSGKFVFLSQFYNIFWNCDCPKGVPLYFSCRTWGRTARTDCLETGFSRQESKMADDTSEDESMEGISDLNAFSQVRLHSKLIFDEIDL